MADRARKRRPPPPNDWLSRVRRSNRLSLTRVIVVDAHDGSWWQVRWWLNGRILGRYISVNIPWAKMVQKGRDDE